MFTACVENAPTTTETTPPTTAPPTTAPPTTKSKKESLKNGEEKTFFANGVKFYFIEGEQNNFKLFVHRMHYDTSVFPWRRFRAVTQKEFPIVKQMGIADSLDDANAMMIQTFEEWKSLTN
jgi:hypothetical protein